MSLLRFRNVFLCMALLMLVSAPAAAQFGGGGFGGGGFGGGGGGFGGGGGGFGGGGGGFGGGGGGFGGGGVGGGGGGNTIGAGQGSGVIINAGGVLSLKTINDPTGELTRQRAIEAFGALEGDLTQKSPLRKISLNRLEKAVRKAIEAGDGPDEAMKHLAGLTGVEYVYCYPESGDVVIAGPAEPWGAHLTGRKQGLFTGRPVLQLQDLIVALRCFPPSGKSSDFIYCSIDPTQKGLARMQQFLRRWGGQARPDQTQVIVNGLQQSLGPQVVTVGGVPADTHFAQVLVEADYRMKLIGIGLERPPVKIVSYVEKVNPGAVSRNAMQRWYFVPNYECVRVSDDGLAMQMVGDGVRLVSEGEVVRSDGTRRQTGRTSRASRLFVKSFTEKYPKLAERSPVYAQLRNCIDLTVVAAFIQKYDFYGKTNWEMQTFGDEAAYAVQTVNAPKQVASAVNAMWRRSTLITPIGGGVTMNPAMALQSDNLFEDEEGKIGDSRQALDLSGLAADQWWWD